MQWDGEDPARRAKHRDRTLRDYVARELGTYSPFYRRRLREARVDPGRVRALSDLARVKPVTWDDVADDPGAFVLAPSQRDLVRRGERNVALAIASGRLLRRSDRVNREIVETRFRPTLWIDVDGVPVGYTDTDLDLLARAGSRALGVAGLTRDDVIVGLTDPGVGVGHWQLILGARHGGVPALHLGGDPDPEAVRVAAPTALAGGTAALGAVLEAGVGLERVRCILVVGEDPDSATRAALMRAGAQVCDQPPVVVAQWAPTGARALWAECPNGAGFHTFPDLEIVEVARGGGVHATGGGQLVWSALGWRGTVVFRLLTEDRGDLRDTTCERCDRRGPLVVTGSSDLLHALEALEGRPEITSFFVEVRRRRGVEEVGVSLSLRRGTDREALFDDLEALVGASRYKVLPKRDVDAKVGRAGSRLAPR